MVWEHIAPDTACTRRAFGQCPFSYINRYTSAWAGLFVQRKNRERKEFVQRHLRQGKHAGKDSFRFINGLPEGEPVSPEHRYLSKRNDTVIQAGKPPAMLSLSFISPRVISNRDESRNSVHPGSAGHETYAVLR